MIGAFSSRMLPLLVAAAMPLCSQPAGRAHIPLPAELSGDLNGSGYRIRVPQDWNGVLLVYVHGYQFSPGSLIVPLTAPSASPSLEDQLLSLRYAVAASFFVENSIREGIQHTLALTNFFNGAVGKPQRVLVWGTSMGGLISIKLIETYPAIFDGAISCCNGIGGLPKQVDSTLALSLAYAAAFGWPPAWGQIGDLRDSLNLFTEVLPLLQSPDATNFGRWEFIRLVMKTPPPAWWDIDPLDGVPGLFYQIFQATTRRSQLQQEYGGPVAQNIGAVYTLTDSDKIYLAGLGVNAGELLAWMNTQTNIATRRSAREHLEHYGSPSGDLARPVISIHKIYDGDVRVSHEAVYRDLVESKANGDKLVQVYVNAAGHCSFSAAQFLSTVAAMTYWLDTGVRPDASFFQASNGFDNSFVPPPWPF